MVNVTKFFGFICETKTMESIFQIYTGQTSYFDLPKILKISLSKGVAVFLLIILVFNSLKSTTGLLFLVPFLATNITGEVWVLLFFVRIQRETSIAIYSSIRGLSSSYIGNGLTKYGESSSTSISILMLGHLPISSLRGKASLCVIGTMYPNHHSELSTFQIFSQRSHVYTCEGACMTDMVIQAPISGLANSQ